MILDFTTHMWTKVVGGFLFYLPTPYLDQSPGSSPPLLFQIGNGQKHKQKRELINDI